MRRQSYSFDLNTLDNNTSSKANSIKLSDCYWTLLFLLSNSLIQIIFLHEFQLAFNFAVLVCFSYLFYSLYHFEEKDIYEKDKLELLEKIVNYSFYFLIASVIFSALSLGMYNGIFVKFDSKLLLEKYFSVIIFYFVIVRIIACALYKKYVKDMFPFYKVENKSEE